VEAQDVENPSALPKPADTDKRNFAINTPLRASLLRAKNCPSLNPESSFSHVNKEI
jgi:hypothetical protein